MNDTDDWYEIEQLDERTWRITEAVVFHTYLVAGDDRAVLFDAGIGVGDLRSVVSDLVDVPVTLVLTHSHWDHIGAANQFDDVRIHDAEREAGGTVSTTQVAEQFPIDFPGWVTQWREADGEFPDGFDPDAYAIQPVADVDRIAPGRTVDLGDRTLEILHVPGHSPGHLAALDRDAGMLFASDVIHLDYSLYIHFGGCDVDAYVETLGTLRAMREAGAFETMYLGHCRPLAGDDLTMIDDFHDGLQAILAGERESDRLDGPLPGRRFEVAGHDVLTKPGIP